MASGKTTPARRGEARLYLTKAEPFLEQARLAADAERYDATLLNAIHAAISGADAVTVALVGRRSTDPDHQRSVDLLEEAAASAPEIRQRSRQLRSLLARRMPSSTSRGRPPSETRVMESNEPAELSNGLAKSLRRLVSRSNSRCPGDGSPRRAASALD
jgi:HEPN domain-containing protein